MQLYEFSTIVIAVTLFFAISAANELGYGVGRYVQRRTTDEVKSLTGSIQGSILGLLALLLGFTFSMSMQKYDARTQALIEEAATIQQAQIGASLLPTKQQDEIRSLLSQYIETKQELAHISVIEHTQRQSQLKQVREIQYQLWQLSNDTQLAPEIRSIIRADFKRDAQINNHVPDIVLYLLFFVFVTAVTILGYSAGLSGKRLTVPIALVSILITLIVYIIIDLDRPKRGLIKTELTPLMSISDRQFLLNSDGSPAGFN
ncbi:hypothetical protein J1N51_08135 [Psychrosphaera ytuae]|uniref:DUF4239 domain-containing protein n=1 Tax=Psychrosphaera ytuae TaxID=2820710 RepID=A0A975D9D1_9GAMM|nr:hypothetical protein [Psychrosphaera ytuae]QTH62748.1 hypothetical protein J1N51_08135 [Psychrosphaera ytuae]